MRRVDIKLPRDILEALLKGTQPSVPFTIGDGPDGPPLYIVIWADKPRARNPRLGRRPKENEDV